jgi:hypothetical protein
MKRAGTVLGLVIVAIAVTTASAGTPVSGRPKFGTNTVQGTYGLSHEVGVATQKQFTELALVRFDGRGKCTFRLIPNGAGLPVDDVNSVSCSYEVSKDGVGSMNVEGDDGIAFALTFVLVDGGKVFRYMFSAPNGFQGMGEGSRQ